LLNFQEAIPRYGGLGLRASSGCGKLRRPGGFDMTAEVCLMNRLAIVIAADSASTVTQWTEKGSERTLFQRFE
jgi:hypothetical protein